MPSEKQSSTKSPKDISQTTLFNVNVPRGAKLDLIISAGSGMEDRCFTLAINACSVEVVRFDAECEAQQTPESPGAARTSSEQSQQLPSGVAPLEYTSKSGIARSFLHYTNVPIRDPRSEETRIRDYEAGGFYVEPKSPPDFSYPFRASKIG